MPRVHCTGSLLGSAYILKLQLSFKLLSFGSTTYLAGLLKPYFARALRSHGQRLLARSYVKTCISSMAFGVTAPSIWNSLPLHVRLSPSICGTIEEMIL